MPLSPAQPATPLTTSERASIHASNLSIRRGRRLIVNSVSFDAEQGINLLLGSNGAGKSTILDVLGTIAPKAAGSFSVGGVEPDSESSLRRIRTNLGYLPQHFDVDRSLTVEGHLRYCAWLNEVPTAAIDQAVERALAITSMGDLRHRRAKQLSGGERQRLGIACSIIHEPATLLLDEPTVGLDPAQRARIITFVRRYAEHHTVLLTTHVLEDIADLHGHVLILDAGHIRYDDTYCDLIARGHGETELTTLRDAYLDVVGAIPRTTDTPDTAPSEQPPRAQQIPRASQPQQTSGAAHV